MVRVGIGQDSHRFEPAPSNKPLLLGAVLFEACPGLAGNSDADVVLHAVTNAVSGVTGVNILGKVSDDLCLNQGITDSRVYLTEALKYLDGWRIAHLSLSIEAQKPKITPKIPAIKQSLADLLGILPDNIGVTATTGEGLSAFGRGEGIQVFACITVMQNL
jgi:2-C-methyl-D-erythritol 2,4-cyclodiphosphate synthase